MLSEFRPSIRATCAVAAMLMLSACMTRGTTPAGEQTTREERAVTGQRAESGSRAAARERRREQPQAQPEADEVELADVPEESLDVIAALLAERRRSDFPAVEFQDAGFTITEQQRIGATARSDYEAATSLFRQQRFEEGITRLLAVTEDSPGLTAPYIDLAIAYGNLGDTERAEQALETAKALSPENPVVHNELGILYRKTGRFSEARASYETALSIFEEFHYARRNLAVLCDLYLGDLECALENYQAYLDSVGGDSEVEIWVADIENRLGR